MTRTEKQQALAERFSEVLSGPGSMSTADLIDVITVASKLIAFLITQVHPNERTAQTALANRVAGLVERVLDLDPNLPTLQ